MTIKEKKINGRHLKFYSKTRTFLPLLCCNAIKSCYIQEVASCLGRSNA